MRMPSHTALCSFVFSTILTSALIPSNGDVSLASAGAPAVQMAVQTALRGLHAEGFAGSETIALPAPAASPAAVAASAESPNPASEVVNKLVQMAAATGHSSSLVAYLSNALGLAATG